MARRLGETWEWTAGPEQPARSQSTAQARSQPVADQPRVRHGPDAAISQGNHSSVPGPGPGHPSLSRAPSGQGTCGVPSSADPARRTGRQSLGPKLERLSGQPRVKPGQSRTRGAAIRPRDPEQAAAGYTARTDSENWAPAGKTIRGPEAAARRSVGDGRHGPTGPGTGSRPSAHTVALPVSKLEPSKPGPGPAARLDSTTALQAQRTRSTGISSPRCNSDQAQ